MKKIFLKSVFVSVLFLLIFNLVNAAEVNLTIRDGETIVYSGVVTLQNAGPIDLNDSNGNPHSLNSDSVLSVLNDADILSSDFSISDLQYYDSFGSFYLRCIAHAIGSKCDDWQYVVNDTYSSMGMDQNILSGGENVYVYFGPQNKVLLSSAQINTTESVTVTAQRYDYQNNLWVIRTGVTAGLTQPDPNNPWSPTEIQTGSLDSNGEFVFSSIPLGNYNIGIREDFYFPTSALIVVPPPPEVSGGGSWGGVGAAVIIPKATFDLNKALGFLISQQKADGSYGEEIYTDWAAFAIASYEKQEIKSKIIDYLNSSTTTGALLTDLERRAMTLMSLGINPYNKENYIKKITSSFDGKQFGDEEEYNDDIFALVVLQNAGFSIDEKIIQDTVQFILSKQNENGSWSNSVDMTGAGIVALSFAKQDEKVKNSLLKAREFLKQNQKDDGGWGNVSSSSWAMEGVLALGEKFENWTKNSNSPIDYLVKNQDTDGGIKNENIKNKIWETSYVVSVLSGKTWVQNMQKFEKSINTLEVVKEPVKKLEDKKIVSKISKKPNTIIQNTAASINALDKLNEEKDIVLVEKRNWFMRLMGSIFGF